MMEMMAIDQLRGRGNLTEMRKQRGRSKYTLLVSCLRWLTVLVVISAGIYNFEFVKQYLLFFALAAVFWLLMR
jgi:hypothetical protein